MKRTYFDYKNKVWVFSCLFCEETNTLPKERCLWVKDKKPSKSSKSKHRCVCSNCGWIQYQYVIPNETDKKKIWKIYHLQWMIGDSENKIEEWKKELEELE